MFSFVWQVRLPGDGEQGEELQPGAPVSVPPPGQGRYVLSGSAGQKYPKLTYFLEQKSMYFYLIIERRRDFISKLRRNRRIYRIFPSCIMNSYQELCMDLSVISHYSLNLDFKI